MIVSYKVIILIRNYKNVLIIVQQWDDTRFSPKSSLQILVAKFDLKILNDPRCLFIDFELYIICYHTTKRYSEMASGGNLGL